MPKHTTTAPPLPARTIGLDLSVHTLRYCEFDAAGMIVAEGALNLNRALCHYLGSRPMMFLEHCVATKETFSTGTTKDSRPALHLPL